MKQRLYLKVGDTVTHSRHISWGEGEVVEEKHSTLPGGMCLVRVQFADGIDRTFINDLDNGSCCYYTGVKLTYF